MNTKSKTNKEIQTFRHTIVDIYKISIGCCICGYNKHPSALCFDHLPDTDKSALVKNGYAENKVGVGGGMYNMYYKKIPIEDLIQEIKKCRVVCSNCHMELTHQNNERIKSNIDFSINISELEKILLDYEYE
jgi:hypothetical protein